MIELEKAYLDSRKDKASVYFSRLIKKGVPLGNDIRFIETLILMRITC